MGIQITLCQRPNVATRQNCLLQVRAGARLVVKLHIERTELVVRIGGLRVQETAADLPVLLAVLSSLRNLPLADKTIAFGEVGLSGELRPVPNGEERLNEAATHGFKRAIVAKANAPKGGRYKGMDVVAVERLADALEQA